MSENKPSAIVLPALNHVQYSPGFTDAHQHLFIDYLLLSTNFEHPSPHPELVTVFDVD